MIFSRCAFSQVKGLPDKIKEIAVGYECTDLNKLLFLTMKQLREGKADTSTVIYVNQGLQSAIFRYNPSKIRAVDYSSMTLKFENRTYERIYTVVMPEYFGVTLNDTLNHGPAIHKALNRATKRGLKIAFSEGTYYSSIQLTPKIVLSAPVFAYKLTLEGAGIATIKAKHNKDLLNITQGQISFTRRGCDIIVRDLHLDANYKAAHRICANHITNFKLIDCKLTGATQSNLKIDSADSKNYSVYIIRCYRNRKTVGESHNTAGIELCNARYVYIDRFVTDGSKYGIFMQQSDKSFITNRHIDGSKTSSIHISGTGGGELKISNNMRFVYVQYGLSANFNGRLEALHIEDTSGGGANNVIYGNVFFVRNSEHLPLKFSVQQPNKLLTANPIHSVIGSISHAEGVLTGYDSDKSVVLAQPSKGTFRSEEAIKRSITGGSCKLELVTEPKSSPISITGSSIDNIISNNQIKLNPTVGIYVAADNNIISNNNIHASISILKDGPFSVITENFLNSSGSIALNNISGSFNEGGNKYVGAVKGLNTHLDEISQNDLFMKRQIIIRNLPKSNKDLPTGAFWVDSSKNRSLA